MKNKNAFSLMEVMTLLLILSVVAAATIPLVTKRTLNESHGWYACYHKVNTSGQAAKGKVGTDNTLREIRVENKTENNAHNLIERDVAECHFDFPSGNPRPKVYTITLIGAGASLEGHYTPDGANVKLVNGAGSASYEDPNPEIRSVHIASDTWGYLMNPLQLTSAKYDNRVNGGSLGKGHEVYEGTEYQNVLRGGTYGARFGIVDAYCGSGENYRYTFCVATPGEYVRTIYRLNDSDPNELQRLNIQIGVPAAGSFYSEKQPNQPESPDSMKTTVSTASGTLIAAAQGGYRYRNSNGITKIIVPPYNELACKMDGLKLCPAVDGCTMNDYRICVDGGYITDFETIDQLNKRYPMNNSQYWLTNKLTHTPGVFDGQPEYEAFMSVYETKLPDSCDPNGNCYTNRTVSFGDPTLIYFEKKNNAGSAFEYITPVGNKTISNTYLGGSTFKQQYARPGMVFITW